jgi:hypothetical protein
MSSTFLWHVYNVAALSRFSPSEFFPMPLRSHLSRLLAASLLLGAPLASRGEAGERLVIVEPEAAPEQVSEAAALLADTLGELYPGRVGRVTAPEAPATGPRLFVGMTGPGYGRSMDICGGETLDPDGFRLIRHHAWRPRVGSRRFPAHPLRRSPEAGNEWLAIAGASPRGTYYGAAWVLREHYGVQWFFPGDEGVDLPVGRATLLPELSGTIEPSFEERVLGHGLSPEQRAWSLRNGLGGRYSYNHNLHRLTEPEVFAAHPAWQSTIGGVKRPRLDGRSSQPNLADPGYAAYIAERVRAYFQKRPQEPSVSLGTTDSTLFDTGSQTRALVEPFRYFRGYPDYSDLIFTFSNRVAERLFEDEQVTGPGGDKVLTQLAYMYAEDVPTFKLHPQIMPWLTSDRAQWFDPECRAEDRELIRRWARTGVNKIGTWDYYEGVPYFIPRYYPTIIGESLPYLYAQGVRSFFAEGVRNPGLDDPKLWLAAQLLWDVDQDPAALLDEYFTRCYGDASGPMRRFFDRCEQAWMDQPPPGRWLKYFTSPSQATLFPLELCDELTALLDEARAQADSDQIRRRVQRVADSFAFTVRMVETYEIWARLAALPRLSSADAAEWLAAQAALEPAVTGHWRSMSSVLVLLRASPVNRGLPLPTGEPLVRETFDQPIFGEEVATAQTQPGVNLKGVGEGQWNFFMDHTEAMRLEQSAQVGRDGPGLRVAGSKYFEMDRRLPVRPGERLILRVRARGRLSGDAQVYAILRLRGADGAVLGRLQLDALPPGEHGWLPLTVVAETTAETAQAEIRLIIQQQGPGDWVDLDDIMLYASPRE